MSEPLTMESFQPHLNKTFKVRGGHHAFPLVKIEEHRVEDDQRHLITRTPFTLIFRSVPGDILPTGLWTFDVEGEDVSFDLYVMAIHSPFPGDQDYQASFN
ncbi:MAG: hypothetical protein EON95_08930 [Caulobacteraceae bacterium]|nr:hypothetical protein [Caulobacter sp.]RYF93446.1 MAG: hypothetical protein EON95_08930 [Caulobacteraceae bacterium]